MFGRFLGETEKQVMREETGVIESFDASTGAYLVRYKGAIVGPIWSANGIRHPMGTSIKVLVKDGLLVSVIP